MDLSFLALGVRAASGTVTRPGRSKRRLHIVYIAAAGDIVASYEHWRSGSDADHEGALSYSAGVFGAIRSAGATGICLAPCSRRERTVDGDIHVENIAPMKVARGLAFYWVWLLYSIGLVWRLVRERPDMLFMSDRVIFYPCLLPLRMFGTRIVHIFHVAPWNACRSPGKVRRLLLAIELIAMRRLATATLGLHGRVADQLRAKVASAGVEVWDFVPEWPIEALRRIPPADHAAGPFRIFFVGRAEESKGVFDLLEAFGQSSSNCHRQLHLDYFGDGNALPALREKVARHPAGEQVTLHGQCSGSVVREYLAQAHLLVVPTRTEFIEGLNKVVVEGLLAGRPVVSSVVCPSADLVPGTVVLATPDDPASYAAAITRLAEDPAAYAEARRGGIRFAEWLDTHRRPLGLQVGALIAHSAMRGGARRRGRAMQPIPVAVPVA